MYEKKLEVFNIIAEQQGNDNRKFQLIHEYEVLHKYFKGVLTYLPKLMNFLWSQPKIVAKLLAHSNNEDVKSNLAPFIGNNFYENMLSSVYIEDNLMYIISLLLMDEIKALNKNEVNNFLNKTPGGYLLEQLEYKTDVQIYFKTIMLSLVEKLETMDSSKKINFEIDQIEQDYIKAKELMEKNYQKNGVKQRVVDRNFFRKKVNVNGQENEGCEEENSCNVANDVNERDLFNKYISEITKKELEEKIEEYKENKGMKEYLNAQLNIFNQNPINFSNIQLLQKIYNSSSSSEVLALFQIDFFKVIKILDELFENLKNNIYLIPYSVKCICKIISVLIKKKFPNINIIEQNAIISKFFFSKLFLPVFRNPGIGALINNFIISGTTIHNLDIISFVIEKFISGGLFETEKNEDFTPFNWYFLNKMPELLNFFENITKVKLPPFIEKLINGTLPANFEYKYFDENPDEVVFHRSICFSMDDLFCLIKNMKSCKNILFNDSNNKDAICLSKTLEKILYEDNMKIIIDLRSSNEYEMKPSKTNKKDKKGKKILNFFLLNDLLINDKYKELFSFKQQRPNFTIKELECTNNEEDRQKNNIIKVKNILSSLLYNYRTLVKTDFDEGTTDNTIKIFKELKKFMKTSNFVIDGTIPSEWYVNTLITQIKLLPANLKANDYEGLFKELENDINNSIKEIDFETMSVCLGKVKFAKRGKINYENAKNAIKDLELNKKAQSIIETEVIPSSIYFKYTEKEKEFKIEKGKNTKDSPICNIINDENEKKKNCITIESFVNRFPDIGKIQQLQDIDLFILEQDLKLIDELTFYFKLIKETLKKKLNLDENEDEFKEINTKIYDYIMEKIYDKIYPSEPQEEDNIIYKQCVLLSWVEPKHFLEGKTNYIFDSFLPDVFDYFDKIEKEKSPRKKIENMSKIFVSIENVVKFNGDSKNLGVDDQLPILNYAFIKAHPLNIYTNMRFMMLFLGSKKLGMEDNQLVQLKSICLYVKDIDQTNFKDLNAAQYNQNCRIAAMNND
jgi:hypothetical protein